MNAWASSTKTANTIRNKSNLWLRRFFIEYPISLFTGPVFECNTKLASCGGCSNTPKIGCCPSGLYLSRRRHSVVCGVCSMLKIPVFLEGCIPTQCAPVAQLDRATGYEPVGRRFDSFRAHHFSPFSRLSTFSSVLLAAFCTSVDVSLPAWVPPIAGA